MNLNGQWDLYYALETREMEDSPEYLRRYGEKIPAEVPGNVELDLERAGREPDPFYAENIYRFRKYEFYRWQFERSFDAPEHRTSSRWLLVFEGLNCFADVYLNDEWVGESANAMIAHPFDVTDVLRYGQSNRLTVRIRSAVNQARKVELPAFVETHESGEELMALRMPSSSFGWDIMGRFLSAGMWRGVHLEEQKATRIANVYYATRSLAADGTAVLQVRYRWETDVPILDGYELRVRGVCGESSFEEVKYVPFVEGVMKVAIPQAKLWWPKGYGDASLYTVTMTLEKDGVVLDERTDRVGIRRLEVELVMAQGDAGEFLIRANGVPILCKGSNWVPLDALHSRDAQRLEQAHALLDEAGCNIVRCWGGNVYEDHAFFDLCDQRGIMVWQDFGMACATYSALPDFARQMEQEATFVVKKLRNHPCILLWAGDNEVDESSVTRGYASEENRYNALTREVLPRVVRMHDPYRYYLPSSPYIPAGFPLYAGPEQHNWGARAYFKDDFYKHTTAHFISECGYHGCPSVESLQKYIPQEYLSSWLNSDVWDTHNTDYIRFRRRGYNRIGLMQDQVELLFGQVPEDLETFAKLSQISQAEAKKFFIERTRIKKWRRTGIIWWNLLDGWPQISDAVVDYYFVKKLAYEYIKRVQQPIAVLMDELQDWGHAVWLCNDSRESRMVSYKVWNGDTGEVYLEGETLSPANENVKMGVIRELAGQQKLYLITWSVDGREMGNHYLSGFPSYDAAKMLDWVQKIAALPEAFQWNV